MSEHCEHCTDSCDLYFDISDRPHTSGKSWWASDHCPYCDERAAIVAWLRECAQRYADMYGQPVDSLPAHMYAGWIERGEHVKGTDDSSHVSGTCKEGCDDE